MEAALREAAALMIMADPAEKAVKDAAYWTQWHLENWANWMTRIDLPKGVPDHACGGFENYTTHDANSERAYDALDLWAAETTHRVVQALSDIERAAVDHRFIQAVYRFPRGNFDEVMARAIANIEAGLRRRGVWLGE